MQVIAAYGSSWPVETFLDAHRFQRCEGEAPQIADLDFPLRCVTRDLALIEVPARHAPWPEVIAFRAPDLSTHFDECEACGGVTVVEYRPGPEPQSTAVVETCSQCQADDDDDWDYD